MFKNFQAAFLLVLQNKNVLFNVIFSDMRQRHKGSVLGTLWFLIHPIILLSIYTVVYLFVFKLRPSGMGQLEYVLHIFAGLVPFLSLSESFSIGVTSLESNKSLLKNTIFPVALIPLRSVLSTLPGFFFGLLILIVASFYIVGANPYLLLIPIVVLFQYMFIAGLIWVLSLATIIVKDLKNIVTFIITIMMIGSPIAYDLNMLDGYLKLLVWLNPAAYFVITYQNLIVSKSLPPGEIFLFMGIMSVLTYIFGFTFFRKLGPVVANYV